MAHHLISIPDDGFTSRLYTPRICLTIPYHTVSQRVVLGIHANLTQLLGFLPMSISFTHIPRCVFQTTRQAGYNVGTLRETSMSLKNPPGLPQPSTLSSQSLRLSGQLTFPMPMQMVTTGFLPSLLFPFHPVNWNHPVGPGSTPGPPSHYPRGHWTFGWAGDRNRLSPGIRQNSPKVELGHKGPPRVSPGPLPGPAQMYDPPLFISPWPMPGPCLTTLPLQSG